VNKLSKLSLKPISSTHRRFLTTFRKKRVIGSYSYRKYHTSNTNLNDDQSHSGDALPIFELSPETFRDALTSSDIPLIVEFYLPESEASDTMFNKLASKVHQYKGSLRLGRMNVDEYSSFAAQLKISQVPAVFGFYMGQPIANFNGIPTDQQLDQFTDMLLKFGSSQKVSELIDEANQLLESDQIDEAIQKFQEILHNPSYKAEAVALSGLARCSLKKGNIQDASELVDIIQTQYIHDLGIPEVVKAISAVELAKEGEGKSESLTELEERVNQEPNDLQLKYDYANALWVSGRRDEAMEQLFVIIKKDKEWNDQAARKFLVKIFESLGPDHPSTIKGRRRFSNLWFS